MARQTELKLERHIGDKIRRRRAEIGLTQEELGRDLAISYQQIQKYESGANRISASRLQSLARRLEVEIGWFFEGFDTRARAHDAARELAPNPRGRRSAIEIARTFNTIDDAGVKCAVGALVRAVIERQALPGG